MQLTKPAGLATIAKSDALPLRRVTRVFTASSTAIAVSLGRARSTRMHRAKTSDNQHQQTSSYKVDSRLPPGIDHEIPLPRWSAAYSLFSEVMRLIPPTGPRPACDGERMAASDEQDPSEKTSRQGDNRLSRARDSPKQTACEMNTVDSDTSLLLTPKSLASEGSDATSVLSDLDSLPGL
ncbi:hypothetical protein BDV39DRAFT_204366 [Aspergillus sergii]|uniref:Uncharacterized protein n=1 Tax=Aspergillus sergii TaxID=1034303 RepID=A0A5N6X4U9_9EURO|nr:hypothetical protein BDV39DRAFT_204366 [Aspergillus sergii]